LYLLRTNPNLTFYTLSERCLTTNTYVSFSLDLFSPSKSCILAALEVVVLICLSVS